MLSAAGAGAVVPGLVLAAALVVGVGGGGLGGLGALSQAFTGPEIPGTAAGEERSRERARTEDASRLLASAQRAVERRAQTPAATGGGGGSGDGDSGGGGGGRGPAQPPPTTPPPTSEPPTAVPPPAAQPPAQPPEQPSVVRQLGDSVNEVVAPVPIVGPTATQVVDTLVDTVDQIPPLLGRAP